MDITPGEWRAVKNPMRDDGYFVLAGGVKAELSMSAMIATHSISQGQFKNGDDARLIAAAPKLLAALKELLVAGDESVISDDDVASMLRFGKAVEDAKAAIAKAEGR